MVRRAGIASLLYIMFGSLVNLLLTLSKRRLKICILRISGGAEETSRFVKKGSLDVGSKSVSYTLRFLIQLVLPHHAILLRPHFPQRISFLANFDHNPGLP